jgi:5-methylcytosine-specific restriction endonuclease McrA
MNIQKQKQYPAAKRRWYLANRVLCILRAKIWQATHPMRVSLKNRRWKRRNIVMVRATTNAYRRKLRNARPRSADKKAIRDIYKQAALLREQGHDVHVDHKIPISRGGLHIAANLQILPAILNMRKGNKLDYTPAMA